LKENGERSRGNVLEPVCGESGIRVIRTVEHS